MVKQSFKAYSMGCQCPPDFPVCTCGKVPQVRVLTKKPVQAGKAEVDTALITLCVGAGMGTATIIERV